MTDGAATRSFRGHKVPVLALVVLLAIIDLIVVALASYCIDGIIDGTLHGANSVTFLFVVISLIAGMLTLAAIISGASHLHHYNSGSVGSASTTALIAWVVTLLAFGFACKSIDVGHTGSRERALEAFVFILAFFETLYVLLLHAGLFNNKFGVGY